VVTPIRGRQLDFIFQLMVGPMLATLGFTAIRNCHLGFIRGRYMTRHNLAVREPNQILMVSSLHI
jgi:hypothetical protein